MWILEFDENLERLSSIIPSDILNIKDIIQITEEEDIKLTLKTKTMSTYDVFICNNCKDYSLSCDIHELIIDTPRNERFIIIYSS